MIIGSMAKTAKRGQDFAITQRRIAEDKIARMNGIVADNQKVGEYARWENKSDAKIKRNAVLSLAANLEIQDQEKLKQRRSRLAALIANEEEGYKNELATCQETSVQKANRMVQVARQLKVEREEKRKEAAQEAYNRQWRDGCDDLRLIESEKFKQHCMQVVDEQVATKDDQRSQGYAEAKYWHETMEGNRQKLIDKEESEMRKRQGFNYETKIAILNQMEATRERKAQEARDAEAERLETARQIEEDAIEARRQQMEFEKAQAYQQAKIKRTNDETLHARNEVARMQYEQEKKDLQLKMEAHKQAQANAGLEKQQMRQDMFRYMEYLQMRKDEERATERLMDIACQEEMDRENAKRDMQWMKDRLQREQLMADVYEGRMNQVKQKEWEAMRREEEILVERAAVEKEQAKARRLAEEEEMDRLNKEKERAIDLDRQVQAARSKARIAKHMDQKAYEAAEDAEKVYAAFLKREHAEMSSKPYESKWYGLKTGEWN